MKNLLANIILFFVILFANNAFYLSNFNEVSFQDLTILLAIIGFFMFGFPNNSIVLKKTLTIASISMSILLITLAMSWNTYDQPIIYSLRASRILLGWTFLSLMLSAYFENHFSFKKFHIFFKYITLFIIILHLYVFFSNDSSMLHGLRIQERFGEIRFLIAPTLVIFATLYFLKKTTKLFSSNFIIFIALLGIIFTISKTRGIILPLLIVILINLLDFKRIKMNIAIIGFATIMFIFLYTQFSNYLIQYTEIISEVTNHTSNDNNVSIRQEALIYYLNQMDFVSWILGSGIENKIFSSNYEEKLTLSDIGIFKIIYHHGIMGLLFLCLLFIKLYKLAKRSHTIMGSSIKSFLLFELFCCPTIIFIYSIDGILINLSFYFFLLYESSNAQYNNNTISFQTYHQLLIR